MLYFFGGEKEPEYREWVLCWGYLGICKEIGGSFEFIAAWFGVR